MIGSGAEVLGIGASNLAAPGCLVNASVSVPGCTTNGGELDAVTAGESGSVASVTTTCRPDSAFLAVTVAVPTPFAPHTKLPYTGLVVGGTGGPAFVEELKLPLRLAPPV